MDGLVVGGVVVVSGVCDVCGSGDDGVVIISEDVDAGGGVLDVNCELELGMTEDTAAVLVASADTIESLSLDDSSCLFTTCRPP